MKEKVLIIDDSVSMRQMTSIILTQAGYEVVQAVDGKDALSKLTQDIKLVLTDLNMPNMGGIELIKAIRGGTVNKAVPIIMVTTESEEAMKLEGKKAGASAWIVKPFNQEVLIGTIKKVTGSISF